MAIILEEANIKSSEKNFSDKKNIYAALSYDDIKEISDKLIERNLQAYITLANA